MKNFQSATMIDSNSTDRINRWFNGTSGSDRTKSLNSENFKKQSEKIELLLHGKLNGKLF